MLIACASLGRIPAAPQPRAHVGECGPAVRNLPAIERPQVRQILEPLTKVSQPRQPRVRGLGHGSRVLKKGRPVQRQVVGSRNRSTSHSATLRRAQYFRLVGGGFTSIGVPLPDRRRRREAPSGWTSGSRPRSNRCRRNDQMSRADSLSIWACRSSVQDQSVRAVPSYQGSSCPSVHQLENPAWGGLREHAADRSKPHFNALLDRSRLLDSRHDDPCRGGHGRHDELGVLRQKQQVVLIEAPPNLHIGNARRPSVMMCSASMPSRRSASRSGSGKFSSRRTFTTPDARQGEDVPRRGLRIGAPSALAPR